jgi:hypothetical protein
MMEIVLGLLFCWGLLWVSARAALLVLNVAFWLVGGGRH